MTFTRSSSKRKDLERSILRCSPTCIYQLAKNVGRPYRRVHDQVHALAEAGLVTLQPVLRNNRKTTLVISNDPYYQRLQRLDDLYDAGKELMR
jgi:predicted transcriptional regulator